MTWDDPNPYQLTAEEKRQAIERAEALRERLERELEARRK